MPPMIPANNPDTNGAPEASAIPRQSGSATKNTTRPDFTSAKRVLGDIPFVVRIR
jgi:hypothetical protein